MLRLCGDSVAEHGGETLAFLTIVRGKETAQSRYGEERGKEELFSQFRPRDLRAGPRGLAWQMRRAQS